jgi:hypothetical protein
MPWMEGVTPFEPRNLRRRVLIYPNGTETTKGYTLDINGTDYELEPDDLTDHKKLKWQLEHQHRPSLIVPPMKAEKWDTLRQTLHDNEEIVPVQLLSDTTGIVLEYLGEYLLLRLRAMKEDSLTDPSNLTSRKEPYRSDNEIAFSLPKFLEHLTSVKRFRINQTELQNILRSCRAEPRKVCNKPQTRAWFIPLSVFEDKDVEIQVLPERQLPPAPTDAKAEPDAEPEPDLASQI